MLGNHEPDRNLEELTDDEIYAAILYLELDQSSANKRSGDTVTTKKENDDKGVLICVCLYIALFGSLALLWLYLK